MATVCIYPFAALTNLTHFFINANYYCKNVDSNNLAVELKNSQNILSCSRMGDGTLGSHLATNRAEAEKCANQLALLTDIDTLSAEDRTKINSRASAIRFVAGETNNLTAEQKQNVATHLKKIESLTAASTLEKLFLARKVSSGTGTSTTPQ